MKTFNYLKTLAMSAALLISGAFTSCDKGEEEVVDFSAEISATATATSVQAGETVEIAVVSNTDWTASTDDPNNILTLSATSGHEGSSTVTAKIADTAADKQKASVTFTAMGHFAGFDVPARKTITFTVSSTPAGSAIFVDNIADLAAGTYYLCGYLEQYTPDSGSPTTYAPYSYHAWTGEVTSGSSAYLATANYQYDAAAKTLTRSPSASGQAAEIEVIAADGENTYYIKCGSKYLANNGASNHQLAESDEPAAWVATDFEKGGILLTCNGASLTTADATRNMLRSYANPSSRSYGVVFFKASEIELVGGSGGGDVQEPTEYTAVTVAEFNAAAESQTEVYELVGTVSGSINTTYGNFDLVDETGSVYVYGLTKNYLGYGSTNDQSYSQLGISSGDKIKIRGYRGSYNGKIEVMYAWFIEHLGEGEVPEQPSVPGTGFKSDSQFVCSKDDSNNKAYSLGDSTFNGESATGFKLGTGSLTGKFTSAAVGVTGDYTLSLYGVAWNKAEGTLKVSVNGGGSVEGTDTYDFASNSGASGNAPFTITVTESDHYTFLLKDLTPASTITFETLGTAYRVVVAGIHLTEGHNAGGGTTDPDPDPETPGDVKAVTVAEFNAAAESQTQVYQLTGVVSGSINTTYGNFDLVDETGSVYVYGLTATNLGYGATNDKSYSSLGINAGDKIKINGYRGSYNGKIEVMYAWLVEIVQEGSTDPDPDPETPGDVKAVTVADFNAAAESQTQVYQLTGVVSGSINTTYGNFDLVDETGSVYVYGLTATNLGYGATNDKSYSSLGINAGDKIKINGYRGSYNGKIEVMYAWLVEIVEKASGEEPGTGGGDTPAVGDFGSDSIFVCSKDDSTNKVYTLGDSTFNGEGATGFKLGTSSATGKFTSAAVGVTGDYTLSLYGVAWKGQKGTLKVSVAGGGSVEGTASYELKSNDGASNNAPYTITVTEGDHYTFSLKGLTANSTITFETEAGAYRVIAAGIHLEK